MIKNTNHHLKLWISLVLCIGGGWLSGLFTNTELKGWYPKLTKSMLTPPEFVFPLVWTFLYILMGISLYLIWKIPGKSKIPALLFFVLQLFFNFIWSFIFFYLQKPIAALVDIGFLWIAIMTTIFFFNKLSKTAAYLLVPYFLWVSFAFYLNLFICRHN
jgi:benzodiazapine receptor